MPFHGTMKMKGLSLHIEGHTKFNFKLQVTKYHTNSTSTFYLELLTATAAPRSIHITYNINQ